MRRTSKMAYDYIKETKKLPNRQWQVYDVLYHHGPLTAGEIWKNHLAALGAQLNSVSPRTAELERRGAIEAIGERECSVTGYVCALWDVTPDIPTDEKKAPKQIAGIDPEQLAQLIAENPIVKSAIKDLVEEIRPKRQRGPKEEQFEFKL